MAVFREVKVCLLGVSLAGEGLNNSAFRTASDEKLEGGGRDWERECGYGHSPASDCRVPVLAVASNVYLH